MNDPASSLRQSRPAWLCPVLIGLLAVCLAGYALFLVRHMSPYAGGSDPSGYLNNARILSRGELCVDARTLPGFSAVEFGGRSNMPLGFRVRSDGRLAPTYPPGYPLQLILAAGFGWDCAVTVLNTFTALVGGFLLFAYGRLLGLTVALSLGGVMLLWLCPLFIFSALLPMSDLSAATWSLVVLYCACRGRDDWKWALLCGVATGIAVLVRPTNLLLGIPVLVALGAQPRSWLAVVLGGLPSALFIGFYNLRLHGSPFVTGYDEIGSLLRWENVPHNLAHFAHWIPALLSPLVVLIVVAPFVVEGRQRGLLVLAVWAAVLIGFYSFYFHSGETWWYLRFILPAFPGLILAALVGLGGGWRAGQSRPVLRAVVLVALLFAAAGWQVRQIRQLDVMNLERGERAYADAAHWAQENVPPGSVIFCLQVSGAFFYYTDFILFRWDQVYVEKYDALLGASARQNRLVYAVLFPFESPEALEKIGGHWTKLTTVGQVTFWQRQP